MAARSLLASKFPQPAAMSSSRPAQTEDDDSGNNYVARVNKKIDLSPARFNLFPSHTLYTNIEANYKPDWGGKEAFREFL